MFSGELRCLNEKEPSASRVCGRGGRGGSLLPHAGFPLVKERGGDSLLPWEGFSLSWLLLLWSLGPRAHELQTLRLSCTAACGSFPDQGPNRILNHWATREVQGTHHSHHTSLSYFILFCLRAPTHLCICYLSTRLSPINQSVIYPLGLLPIFLSIHPSIHQDRGYR